GTRLWMRHDLLAPAARLAAGGRVASHLGNAAQRAGPGRRDQSFVGGHRQLFGTRHFWGEKTGPNPTDRGKRGSKRHLITDAEGVPFWFTGCGPCMSLIPEEQRLAKKYKESPFVLLGVCADESLDQGRKTATEHGIDWPCWFDGQNGPIARDWNV